MLLSIQKWTSSCSAGVSHLYTLTVFKSDGDGNIVLSIRKDGNEKTKGRVIVAAGNTFESTNAIVMSQAVALVKELFGTCKDSLDGSTSTTEATLRSESSSDWYDGLTYCTWNGLGQDLTQSKILHGLEALDQTGIKITNLIIDDQWQSLDNPGKSQYHRGWTDFEAHKEGFPDGLKSLTTTIREMYPHVKHIATWHGFVGYWGGFSAIGGIAQRYRTRRVHKIAEGFGCGTEGEITVVYEDDIHRMYKDFYRYVE